MNPQQAVLPHRHPTLGATQAKEDASRPLAAYDIGKSWAEADSTWKCFAWPQLGNK